MQLHFFFKNETSELDKRASQIDITIYVYECIITKSRQRKWTLFLKEQKKIQQESLKKETTHKMTKIRHISYDNKSKCIKLLY